MFRRRKRSDDKGSPRDKSKKQQKPGFSRANSLDEDQFAQMQKEEAARGMFGKTDDALLSYLRETNGMIDADDIVFCKDLLLLANGEYSEKFMSDITPKLNNEQLFNLTQCLMRAHVETKQYEPLLRGTDLLSGSLYVKLANRIGYNPLNTEKNASPMLDVLNHYVAKSVLYKMAKKLEFDNTNMSDKDIAKRNGSIATVIIVKLDPAGINDPTLSKEYMMSKEYITKVMAFQGQNAEIGQGNHPEIVNPVINSYVTATKPLVIGNNFNYDLPAYAAGSQPWQEANRATTPSKEESPKQFLGGARKRSADKGNQKPEEKDAEQTQEGNTPPRKASLEKNESVFFQRRKPSTEGKEGPKEPLIGRRRGPSQSSDNSE